jgi:hypothetical protein
MDISIAIPAFRENKKIAREVAAKALALLLSLSLLGGPQHATAQEVSPVLEFPEAGLDDTSTYRGYTTRFFRDSAGNALQIYINQNNGRIVHLWADAANESISFTARDTAGQPANLTWDSPSAKLSSQGKTRYVQYTLSSKDPVLDIGFFLLGSMRKERDYQYQQRHLLPFGAEPFIEDELIALIENIERLPEKIRRRHLALLNAKNTAELHTRLVPQITARQDESRSIVLVRQPTFDGKNRLSLEVSADNKEVGVKVLKDKISIRSRQRQSVQLTIKIGTDSPSLTPLRLEDIFNSGFFRFYEQVKAEHDSLLRIASTAKNDERLLRFKRLERQVKSMELMSAQEKLLAGLPNYATYFGRDMMMSALMLEPVWKPAMLEHVIASVLRKLAPSGEVSHEEALGGQAIRENAAEYNKLMAKHFQQKAQTEDAGTNNALEKAEKLLGNLQATTENYRMLDDDFQLPVLAARYLARSDISGVRKQNFLQAAAGKEHGASRLALLMRNLVYVSNHSRAYVENPVAENLVDFPRLDEQRWFSGSWRDSGPGYANGRFAMDINVVWVPKALEAIEKIFAALREMNISLDDLQAVAPEIRNTRLIEYAQNPQVLHQAVKTWRRAVRHFEVHLTPQEIQQNVRAKQEWLPQEERTYWESVIAKRAADKESLDFLALSLDEKGQPIPVANTDPATRLFLEDFTDEILQTEIVPEDVLRWFRIFVVPFPAGLFLEGVGPAVANDAHASAEVWANFQRDPYHSPCTIWGREVNLLLLGLAKQIEAAYDPNGRIKDSSLNSYVQELRTMLDKTLTAVEASGLKHNELWSYRIVGNKLLPARYPTTTDLQLWNLTDLAVQYSLDRISGF